MERHDKTAKGMASAGSEFDTSANDDAASVLEPLARFFARRLAEADFQVRIANEDGTDAVPDETP